MWVFDDRAVGLNREPFVAGIVNMINRLVASIPSAQTGFRLVFSPVPGELLLQAVANGLGSLVTATSC